MPYRECRKVSCHALVKIVERGAYYCPAHRSNQPQPWDPSTRCAKRDYAAEDAKRSSTTERGYNGRWQRERRAFLRDNPFCAEHAKALPPWNKVPVPANVVDHIIPHDGDETLFWDQSNWQPLCSRCHNRKTARERMHPAWQHRQATPRNGNE